MACSAWNVPCFPVKPCTMTFVFSSIHTLADALIILPPATPPSALDAIREASTIIETHPQNKMQRVQGRRGWLGSGSSCNCSVRCSAVGCLVDRGSAQSSGVPHDPHLKRSSARGGENSQEGMHDQADVRARKTNQPHGSSFGRGSGACFLGVQWRSNCW